MLIDCLDIRKSYGNLEVLKGVDISVDPGEIVAIIGPSGAGKSTLLHIMGTLDRPDTGKVVIDGLDIGGLKNKELAGFRNRKLGFIFQFHHLLPEFTALENVSIPGYIAGNKEKEVHDRAVELLQFMGLRQRLDHKPSELSGGEQQRVAVARALVNKPAIILADEPTGNLDSANSKDMIKMIQRLREELGQTFVIVTHSKELSDIADRVLEMRDGRFS